jgi:hypothetical protein
VRCFSEHPETQWLFGACRIVNEAGREIRRPVTLYKNFLLRHYSFRKLLLENFISQPATFWRRSVLAEIGYFDEGEHLCMDYDYWLRIGQRYPPRVINECLARFRYYAKSKSGSSIIGLLEDQSRLAKKYGSEYPGTLLLGKMNYYKIACLYKLMAQLGI